MMQRYNSCRSHVTLFYFHVTMLYFHVTLFYFHVTLFYFHVTLFYFLDLLSISLSGSSSGGGNMFLPIALRACAFTKIGRHFVTRSRSLFRASDIPSATFRAIAILK